MSTSSASLRAVTFIDGQNLYHAARREFGYTHPNYDVVLLSRLVCAAQGRSLTEVRFYTGVPDAVDNLRWHTFWGNKLAAMRAAGVHTYRRRTRLRQKATRLYRGVTITLPDGSSYPPGTRLFLGDGTELPEGTEVRVQVADEKGVDARIAVDMIRLAHLNRYDVALIFSQDQDLSEAADEVRVVAAEQGRNIRLASAFPLAAGSRRRSIDRTSWLPISKGEYDACVDPADYR